MAFLPDSERAHERLDEMIAERREGRLSGIVAILLLGPIALGTAFLFANSIGFIQ
jgi:hypothetical protein